VRALEIVEVDPVGRARQPAGVLGEVGECRRHSGGVLLAEHEDIEPWLRCMKRKGQGLAGAAVRGQLEYLRWALSTPMTFVVVEGQ
jgi:hypothetical protein